MTLSRTTLALAALIALCGPSYASPYYGAYTTKAGNCHDEYKVSVSPKSFNQYENYCKVTKNSTEKSGYKNEVITYLNMKCSSEGEVEYHEVWLQAGEKKGTVDAFYPRESPARTVVLYHCNR
ncbi:MAG: hypothetical protein EOO01_26600 [Chitinophagaceae bacterium]|nr:MAG: hypothetical protein EOO01_26600 [Chitinophagaceae bacterium]